MRHDFVLNLLQRIRRRIFLKSSGALSSFKKGEGFDFAELMPYVEGMDARKIYWNSLAKGGELQIKSFYEEKEINICVGVLLSGSLRFGKPVEKYEKLMEISALIGFSALLSANLFQGFMWSEKKSYVTSPSKRHQSVDAFIENIAANNPLYTQISPDKAIESLFQKVRKKSLLFLLSDFLETIDLRKLSKKHEIIAITVRDRFEAHPVALGESVMIDPESGEEVEMVFDDRAAKAYGSRIKEVDTAFVKHLDSLGIRHITIYTDDDAFLKLSKL